MTCDVEVLTYDSHVDRVGEIGVEDVGDIAVGEHLLYLIGIWIGKRHGTTDGDDRVNGDEL